MAPSPLVLTARDIMTTQIVCLEPSTDIFQAIETLLTRRISGAPVVDAAKRLVGVLTEKDCMAILASDAYQDLPGGLVREFMSTKLVTIEPDVDIFSIAGLFREHPFRRVPVCDDHRLVGIVSRRDVLTGIQRMRKAERAPKYPDYRRPT